jgi:hypothetical protein
LDLAHAASVEPVYANIDGDEDEEDLHDSPYNDDTSWHGQGGYDGNAKDFADPDDDVPLRERFGSASANNDTGTPASNCYKPNDVPASRLTVITRDFLEIGDVRDVLKIGSLKTEDSLQWGLLFIREVHAQNLAKLSKLEALLLHCTLPRQAG